MIQLRMNCFSEAFSERQTVLRCHDAGDMPDEQTDSHHCCRPEDNYEHSTEKNRINCDKSDQTDHDDGSVDRVYSIDMDNMCGYVVYPVRSYQVVIID